MATYFKLELTDSPERATHVVTMSIRRTPTIMSALCVTSNFLKPKWLEDSHKLKRLLPKSRKYLILEDSVSEKKFSFSLKRTLVEGKKIRQGRRRLFSGLKIYISDGVAANSAPNEEQLQMMINAAGGEWLVRGDIGNIQELQFLIIITSNPALPSQVNDKNVSRAVENGACIFTVTWLYECMMQQKV